MERNRVLAPLVVLLLRSSSNHNMEALPLALFVCRKRLKRMLLHQHLRGGLYCVPRFSGTVTAILTLEPKAFKENCRLSPETYVLLMELMTENNALPKRHGYASDFSVIVVLYWLAAGMSYRICGNTFDICRTVVFDLANRTLDAMVSIVRQVIKFPTEAELPALGESFGRMADSPVFNLCVGALDGSHVRFICDDVNRHDEYVNRKLFYSINMQALVDDKGRFVDLCVGFPGSCHDLRVLRHSGLYREGVYPPRGYFIIADGGYTCMRDPITIITPYRAVNITEDQRNFNYHLSKARSVVERAFGMLQARWRVLFHRSIEVKFVKAVKVITACAVLHNLCINANDVIRGEYIVRNRQRAPRGERGAEEYRDLMCLAHNVGRHQALIERQEV